MDSFFGGITGGLYYPTITTGATTFVNAAWNVYGQQQYQQQAAAPPPRKAEPETAVEWLDRRVNEMRVSL